MNLTQILEKITQQIPRYVYDAAGTLAQNGFEAYLVGGSLRDLLLNRVPKDYDLATNAYPEDIEKIFAKSIPTGAKFGTMLVLLPDENGETQELEITTYRSEADYFGGRWPGKVEFTKTIQEDLARRDFTVNAIALRLNDQNITVQDLVDPYGGLADLDKRIIRAVGDPVERFTEDGLRPLRACRLAANLSFEIEDNTFNAISKTLSIIDNISKERVRDELMKMLLNSPKPSIGLEYLKRSGVLQIIIPELLENVDVHQPEFHTDDVYTHTLKTIDLAEDEVKLAALFHDIGKARTKSEDEAGIHFYGHDVKGAEIVTEVMKRLKFSNAEIERTVTLVRHHMFYYPNADWRKKILKDRASLKPIKLVIMRHAQTQMNVEGRTDGQSETELTEEGRSQAQSSGEKLIAEIADANVSIISSPLARTLATAEIVKEQIEQKLNKSIELQQVANFQERNFGELQGLTWEEFTANYPELASHPGNTPQRQEYLPAGESIEQVEKRVKSEFINDLLTTNSEVLIIVTHTGIIRIIKRILVNAGLATEESLPNEDLANAGYFIVEVDPKQIDKNFLSTLEIAQVNKEEEGSRNLGGWSDAAIRRFLQSLGGEELIDDLMKLRIADATANPKSMYNPQELQALAERISAVRAQDMALKVTDLDVTGKDLMETFQLQPGQLVGATLNHLLDLVVEDPLKNDKQVLLAEAQKYIESHKK
jgi:tRNA nucleotidyltransferase (CCA-adding enzyme)